MNKSQISTTQTILCDWVIIYTRILNVPLQVSFYLFHSCSKQCEEENNYDLPQ